MENQLRDEIALLNRKIVDLECDLDTTRLKSTEKIMKFAENENSEEINFFKNQFLEIEQELADEKAMHNRCRYELELANISIQSLSKKLTEQINYFSTSQKSQNVDLREFLKVKKELAFVSQERTNLIDQICDIKL